jgi:hypothetical protein
MTIVGAITVVGLMTAAQWTVNQIEFAHVEQANAATTAALDKYLTRDEFKAYLTGEVAHFDGLSARVTILERQQAETFSRLAHDPVENRTFQAVSAAIDKRIDLIQAQITDINRQIAAALIIIDNNAGALHKAPAATLPP